MQKYLNFYSFIKAINKPHTAIDKRNGNEQQRNKYQKAISTPAFANTTPVNPPTVTRK